MVRHRVLTPLCNGSIPFTSARYQGIAQSGSARALGARCREFESPYLDQFDRKGSIESRAGLIKDGVLVFERAKWLPFSYRVYI